MRFAETGVPMTRRKRRTHHRPDHATTAECRFGRGRTHRCYVTDASGQKFMDVTLIQRCPCGERKITRVSRERVPS